MVLTRRKYIKDLLQHVNMPECKGLSTPMSNSPKLSRTGTDVFTDLHLYKSVVGAMQYVTLTCPEIAFCVNKLCQFLAHPLDSLGS